MIYFNGIRTVLRLLLLTQCLLNAHAELKSILQNMIVVVGDSLNISCSSTIRPNADIHFEHNGQVVYAGGKLYRPYDGIFLMNKDITTGTYTLVLPKAKPSDVGVYTCREDLGRGQSSSAKVIVLDSNLSCHSNMQADGFIGPNTCDLQPETMHFSCAVSYHGNDPPSLTWSSSNGNAFPNVSQCHQIGNKINCTLTLEPDPRHIGSVFKCQATAPNGNQYECNTEMVKMQYFLRSDSKETVVRVKEKVACLHKSNRALHVKWTVTRDNQETVISTNETLILRNTGMHRCYVSYSIRNLTCFFLGPIVFAEKEATEYSSGSFWIAISVILIFLGVTIIAFVIYFKRSRKPTKYMVEKVELLQKSETIAYAEHHTQLRDFTVITKASRENKCRIYGIAVLDNELFTISRQCKEFEVYNYPPNEIKEPKRCCKVVDLVNPRNMVACTVIKCLYIEALREPQLSEIIRVDTFGKDLNRWQIKKEIGRISVTNRKTVIVTLVNDSELQEYTFDGKLTREIKIDKNAGMQKLRHAIELDSGNFAICHGDETTEIKGVCIADKRGRLLATYVENKIKTETPLSNPIYLAVDPDGSILVADYKRVLLLSPQLRFRGELLPDVGAFHCIYRVHLDLESLILLIADNKNAGDHKTAEGRVLVYSLNISRLT